MFRSIVPRRRGTDATRLVSRLLVLVVALLTAAMAMAQSAPSGVGAYSNGTNANYIYWNPVPGATGYNVYAGTTSGGEAATAVGTTTGTAFGHNAINAGQRYFYKVTALYGASESPKSAETSAKPGASRTGWPWVTTT